MTPLVWLDLLALSSLRADGDPAPTPLLLGDGSCHGGPPSIGGASQFRDVGWSAREYPDRVGGAMPGPREGVAHIAATGRARLRPCPLAVNVPPNGPACPAQSVRDSASLRWRAEPCGTPRPPSHGPSHHPFPSEPSTAPNHEPQVHGGNRHHPLRIKSYCHGITRKGDRYSSGVLQERRGVQHGDPNQLSASITQQEMSPDRLGVGRTLGPFKTHVQDIGVIIEVHPHVLRRKLQEWAWPNSKLSLEPDAGQ